MCKTLCFLHLKQNPMVILVCQEAGGIFCQHSRTPGMTIKQRDVEKIIDFPHLSWVHEFKKSMQFGAPFPRVTEI